MRTVSGELTGTAAAGFPDCTLSFSCSSVVALRRLRLTQRRGTLPEISVKTERTGARVLQEPGSRRHMSCAGDLCYCVLSRGLQNKSTVYCLRAGSECLCSGTRRGSETATML